MCISKNKQNQKRQQRYNKPLRKLSDLSAGFGRLEAAVALLRIPQAPTTAGAQRAGLRRRRNSALGTQNCAASGTLIVEPNLPREMPTPRLTNINHLLRGKTHETAWRSAVFWEAGDVSRSLWPRLSAASCNGRCPCSGHKPPTNTQTVHGYY